MSGSAEVAHWVLTHALAVYHFGTTDFGCCVQQRQGSRLSYNLQGYRVQLEIWKVLLEDSRWFGMTGPLDPAKFNPSR